VSGLAVWGDYEVHFDGLLGRGGMGSVYRARQRSLDRWVAVKVLDTDRAPDPALREAFLQKFQVEIQALSRLQDPRIVTIFQAGENDGRFWFAMELIEGRTVEQRLFAEGAFGEGEARRIAGEVARALDVAWRQGIVHRDVKPGNIFLGKDASVKLADFGLARSPEFARTRITEGNAVACTPEYASPEQAEGGATDHRADIYSLGCVLYEMLTERPPFSGDSKMSTLLKQASEPPPPPRLLNPEISPGLEAVVLRCLEKDPAARYADYTALLAALEPGPAPEPPREWLWPAAAAAGAALLGVILTAILSVGPPVPPPPPPVVLRPSVVALDPPPPAPPPPPASLPPLSFERVPAREPVEEERAALERLLEVGRETLAERQALRFDGARERLEAFARTEEVGPWVAMFLDAEEERLVAAERAFGARPLFAPGETTVVLRDGRTVRGRVVAEDGAGVTVEIAGGARESFGFAAIAPATFTSDPLARAGAADAAGVARDELEPRHAVGILDQAVEEGLRAAAAGDFRRLLGLEPGGPAWALLPVSRRKLFEEEREGAELYARKETGPLLADKPHTQAGRRAAREVLADFLGSLPAGDLHELVGEVAYAGWAHDLPPSGGKIGYEPGAGRYVLTGPEEGVWIKKPFAGARKGYLVRWRAGSLTDAVFLVALSPARWVSIGPRGAALHRKEGGRATAREVELSARSGAVAVFPAAGRVLVYLDDRLLFALEEHALDEGMRLGVSGGMVTVESIRVKDRTR
jgi:serine/threonine protein kinase